uniref:Uncharacterized protein n=1 Tax=Amphimedon queenslandica TaxID=400682 RepID=A0A1X7SU44_AMPQE
NNDAPTSTAPVVSTVSSSVSVINKPVTSTTSGKHTLNTTLINCTLSVINIVIISQCIRSVYT